jgi:hypothetical protein
MEEGLPYFEEFLTDIIVADARSPRLCKGYPTCNDCDRTRKCGRRAIRFWTT